MTHARGVASAASRPGLRRLGAKATGRGLRSVARGTGRVGRVPVPSGAPRGRRRGRRQQRARPADRAARVQRGRRRRGGDLAGRHAVLPGADRRGARPGGAVPGPDDAAVRDRGAADRAVPRPVQPRPPVGDRRDHGRAGVPVLGAGRRGRSTRVGWLFPAALGVLVASKAYSVTRAAAVPRLLPEGLTLVKANSRISLAGVVGAPCRPRSPALASTFGPEWSLRYAFVRLRRRHDPGDPAARRASTPARARSHRLPRGAQRRTATLTGRQGASAIPPSMAFALRANCGPRWLSGFLTMFMAFLLREHPIGGYSPQGPARGRDRCGRGRQRRRHRGGLAVTASTPRSPWCCPARRRRRRDAGCALLRPRVGGGARLHRRAHACLAVKPRITSCGTRP